MLDKDDMNVKYLYHSGDDLAVANAARVSMAKESMELDEDDEKLIKYLAKHNHWTPFAHNSITIRVRAPLPIRTQCFKHKHGFVENEESRRYISSRPTFYIPDFFREAPSASEGIKQGSSGVHPDSYDVRREYIDLCCKNIATYEKWIDNGVCPEQARFILPQSTQVNWVWTGSLAAYARVYGLRSDSHAQKEIQWLADRISEVIEPLFPFSWKALTHK
jgi:thymidylate synthase (FAD)